jgi:hypothetical protein
MADIKHDTLVITDSGTIETINSNIEQETDNATNQQHDIHSVVGLYNQKLISNEEMNKLLECGDKKRQSLLKIHNYVFDKKSRCYIQSKPISKDELTNKDELVSKLNQVLINKYKQDNNIKEVKPLPIGYTKKQLTINIDERVYKALKMHQIETGIKINEFIEDYIIKELKLDIDKK